MGRKLGGSAQSNTVAWAERPTTIPSGILIHPAIWTQQIWAENWGGAVPLWRKGSSPPNTMWPGPRPTCMPSFILIHPTVWPQYTTARDRQDRNGLIAQGEPFYKRSPRNPPVTSCVILLRNKQTETGLNTTRAALWPDATAILPASCSAAGRLMTAPKELLAMHW